MKGMRNGVRPARYGVALLELLRARHGLRDLKQHARFRDLLIVCRGDSECERTRSWIGAVGDIVVVGLRREAYPVSALL